MTPFVQTLHFQFPGLNGGLIWNRPQSILVVGERGEEQVLPVPDPTRQVLLALLAAALLTWLFFRVDRSDQTG